MYHLDDLGLPKSEHPVDPYTAPSRDVTDKLVSNYFKTVNPLFPIIYKPLFQAEYEAAHNQLGSSAEIPGKWLALFNLILAIGRSHCNLFDTAKDIGNENQADYFLKARILAALDGGITFEIPNLQHIQILGLASIYLLSNHRINRCVLPSIPLIRCFLTNIV